MSGGPFDYDGNPHAATATAVGVDGVTPVDGSFQITYNGDPTAPSAPAFTPWPRRLPATIPTMPRATVTSNSDHQQPRARLTRPCRSWTVRPPMTATRTPTPPARSPSDGVTPVAGDFLITYNGSPTTPTQAGTYAVVANFISSDTNYANATITGTLTISAVAPTLAVDPTPFTYDGTGHAAVVTALGVDGGTPVDGTFSVTYDGSSTPPVDAGTYDCDGHLYQQRSELSLDQHHQHDHDSSRDAFRGPRQRRTVGIHLQRHCRRRSSAVRSASTA